MTEAQLAKTITKVVKETKTVSYNIQNTLFLIIKNEIKANAFSSSKIRLEFNFPINELNITDKRTGSLIYTIPYNDEKKEFFLSFSNIEEVLESIKDLRALITLQRVLRYNNLIIDNINLRLLNKALYSKINSIISNYINEALRGCNDNMIILSTRETNDTTQLTEEISKQNLLKEIMNILSLDCCLEDKIDTLEEQGIQIFSLY